MKIDLDAADLKPLVAAAVAEAMAQLDELRRKQDGDEQLAYSEHHAARLLDLQPHQLRDERLRGRIRASAIVGRRIRYMKSDLVEYLLARRWKP